MELLLQRAEEGDTPESAWSSTRLGGLVLTASQIAKATYFGIPALYQHRVLFWGIVGALVMRAVMILAGIALIERFHWILYVFGAFLIVSGVRMAMARHAPDPEKIRSSR